jgi:exonuclease SbcD
MRILHTADWHLGDRLGRIDRTEDLRRAVERVAQICTEQQADVLLVAGDLFSEMSRPEGLRESIEHLQATFTPFLLQGGTILALTGNHDNETFCRTLQLVMTLAAPAARREGDLLPPGRLYLATSPTFLRLADRDGQQVQFVLMPYPTPTRYLRSESAQRYTSLEEKNRLLLDAFKQRLHAIQHDGRFQPGLSSVLAAHVHVRTVRLPSLFRMSDEESILIAEQELPLDFAYVALGHIHQPQDILGMGHVRYSGSIERLDLGERQDEKGVVIVEVGAGGRKGDPVLLPLPSTPIYAVEVQEPARDLPQLRERYPDAERDLVNLTLTYRAGQDNLEAVLRELEDIFPRWYARTWSEVGELGPPLTVDPAGPMSFQETVRDYLRRELANHPDPVREGVQARAEMLLAEVET